LSFFDDGEETARTPSSRTPRSRPVTARSQTGAPRRPRPRRPARTGRPSGYDQHAVMVRRRIFFGVALVLVIVIVLVINSCVKSEEVQSLKEYNHHVGEIAQEFDSAVATPFFTALAGAGGKEALDVQEQVNQLLVEAQKLQSRAKALSVPSQMEAAQRDLLLAIDLRVEGITKIGGLLPGALGGHSKQLSTKIAGDMETFLASDVIYSQRVAPLIQQTLAAHDVEQATAATRFLPNIGWLEASTVETRLSGASSSSTSGAVQAGHHGSVLKGVSAGGSALEAEPALNHVNTGANPTFTVSVENDGEFNETDVKVNVTVTAAGKQINASHVIDTTEPGKTAKVEIPVSGVALGVASKIEAVVEPVPGETNHEGTKGVYLAIFGQ
jgi:hypothetical protein